MVLRLDSDSTVPTAIAALSSGARVDQVPRPRTKQQTSRFPVQVTSRSRSGSAGGCDPESPGTSQISTRSNAAVIRSSSAAGGGSRHDRLRAGANAALAFAVRLRLRGFARADLGAGQIPLEDFLAVAECADRAALHDGNLVRCGEDP